MEQDCRIKRAEFIGQSVEVREHFSFAHPSEVIFATEKYCSSHYGSNLWNLRGEAASMLFSSWRTHIKLIWHLPRNTRTFFIDSLLAPNISPPRVSLMTRQSKFFHSLLENPSPEAQVLSRLAARDIRSNLGSNLAHMRVESRLNPWEYGGTRLKYEILQNNKSQLPESDKWKIGLLNKFISEKLTRFYDGLDENEELESMIRSLVT